MSGSYALLVTGNEALARLSQDALERAGFEVKVERTGARAQVQLAFTHPDLVVLDLNLPDMPGEIILRQLSVKHRFANTRLILLVEEAIPAPSAPKVAPGGVLSQPFAAPDLSALATKVCAG